MKLYDSRRAPNPRRVRWFMAEKGIEDIEVDDVDLLAGAHAQRAQNAPVPIEQDVRMRGIDRPIRIELLEMRPLHFHLVGGRLEQAVAALFA